MKRLFITTDVSRAKGMYNSKLYKAEKARIEQDFATLPKEYIYDDELKIIVVTDDIEDWSSYNIVQATDYILYHQSSEEPAKTSIKATFLSGHICFGPHDLYDSLNPGGLHDKVFQIIFGDGDDKPGRILNALGFTDDQVKRKNDLADKLRLLHNCLTPGDIPNVIAEALTEHAAAFTTFKTAVNQETDPLGNHYVTALEELRDRLLA